MAILELRKSGGHVGNKVYEGQSISNETFSITLVFLELCN